MEKFISVKKNVDVSVISFVFNEINLEQREGLKEELKGIASTECKNFVLDLSKVGFLSSLVIATIVFFAKEIRANGGEVKLCGLSGEAETVFRLTHLDEIFKSYNTEHEALESFK